MVTVDQAQQEITQWWKPVRQCFVIYCADGSYWGLAYGEKHRDLELEAVMIWTHRVGYAREYEDVTGASRKSAEEVAAEVAKWQAAADRALAARRGHERVQDRHPFQSADSPASVRLVRDL